MRDCDNGSISPFLDGGLLKSLLISMMLLDIFENKMKLGVMEK